MNLTPAPDPLGGMQGPLRAFYDFWAGLPKTDHLPVLSDLLDRMPPALAPYMIIVDVLSPAATKIRFFGTQLVDSAAFDPTGMAAGDLYTAELRDPVHKMLWAASRKPAGYLSRRKIVGRSGFVNVHPSLGLPIDIPSSNVRGIVNYSRASASPLHVAEDRAHLVQEMKFDRWVDIGAGVPG